ncbi:MAG: D-alanine--D-alanine ligase family protein [Actinomycetales bacterium]
MSDNAALVPSSGSAAASRRIRVAVLFGGRSSEHAISAVSAGSVLRALDRGRYDVVPIGISRQGQWVLAADDPARLSIADGRLPEVTSGRGKGVVLAADPTRRELAVSDPGQLPEALGEVDVVLPLLHGPFGEDGTVQGLLEMAGVPYVGSGVFASAAGMDKGHTKALLRAAGLPVGPYVAVSPRAWRSAREQVLAEVATLGMPVFVKPARAGSSMGITKVSDPGDLEPAIAEAQRHDPRVLVEAAVVGREIECGVLEGEAGGPPEASVLAEILVDSGHDFYDFEAKYLEGAQTVVPADLPADVAARVRSMACEAFDVLSCEGLARVDFFVQPDGQVLVNEINTMPGFTPTSMFPTMWRASGLDYPQLLDRLLRTALERGTGLR